MLDENEVLEWMMDQKSDESIEEIDRDTLNKYIETKEFLAVIFCEYDFFVHIEIAPITLQTKKRILTVLGY